MICTLPKKQEIQDKLLAGELPPMNGNFPIKYPCCSFERSGRFEFHGSGMHVILFGEKIADGSLYISESVLADSIRGPIAFCPDYKEYLREIEGQRIEAEELPRMEKEKVLKKFSEYDTAIIRQSTPAIDDHLRKIQMFPGDPDKNVLILCGETGTGKSHLAQALEYQEVRRGATVEFIEWLSLTKKFWAHEDLHVMMDCDLLIIDDFGEEKASEYILESFKNILDTHLTRRQPKKLMITTNKSDYDIKRKYGDKTAGRLFEKAIILNFKGQDYRFRRQHV